MAEVSITLGGHHYQIHCRDGEETHLLMLVRTIEDKMTQARLSTPGMTEIRQLLFASILLADDVHELSAALNKRTNADLGQNGESEDAEAALAARLDTISSRIEALALRLAPGLAPEGANT
jgi:cell division protein ZapA